ncbi:hypothetical protein LSTR_LSTR007553 [Laodelphax striatellus]|uniref:Polynucleotide 5'-hydroxyl-kinase NOL9 n=1 Tax=Laodelphax striatellus TaxID=195883 RepID=A0A482XRE8_LAOST|nr:hypothetical protein LSTR_LSTR007553 [Laodelphax striatellus]
MGKYHHRPKKTTKDNIPLLDKAHLKKKKHIKTSKFSRGYHKLQLLKYANSIANSKCMFNDIRRSDENEVSRDIETKQSNSFFTIIDDLEFRTRKVRLNTSSKEKRKSQPVVENSTDLGEIESDISHDDLKIEDLSEKTKSHRKYQRKLDERSIEAKINAKKYQKRLMKHEKQIEKEKNKKIDAFLDLQHVSLNSEIDFCVIDKSQVLLMMSHPSSLYFHGAINMKVIYGRFEVLGCTLDPHTENLPVYSPFGTSRVRIQTVEDGVHGKLTKETLLNLGVSLENVVEILAKLKNANFAAAVLEKNSSNLCSTAWPEFVEKYSNQKFLPVLKENSKLISIENLLQCKFESEDSMKDNNFYMENPQWGEIFEMMLEGKMRVAICGGKDSGKSTLMRYLVNRCLSRFSSVLVVDCDPGQSEFVPPGCVSAVCVDSPLLGPHFTHLIQPERSVFVGEVDMNRNPLVYINSIGTLMNYCTGEEKYQNIPWIINTMGYSKGFGVVLTSSVLNTVAPSFVVQIKCADRERNFPTILTANFVKRNLLRNKENISEHEHKTLNYRFLETGSVLDLQTSAPRKKTNELKNYSPVVLRKIMILTYFGKLLNKNVKSIFEVVPYMIDYSKINVEILNGDSQLNDEDSRLDVINGSLVALCRKDNGNEDISKYECLGYGIVRAIDRVDKRLFLTTPVGRNIANVDTLVKGSICLPETVYTQPPSTVEGHIPFTSMYIPDSLHQVVRRHFRPTKASIMSK